MTDAAIVFSRSVSSVRSCRRDSRQSRIDVDSDDVGDPEYFE